MLNHITLCYVMLGYVVLCALVCSEMRQRDIEAVKDIQAGGYTNRNRERTRKRARERDRECERDIKWDK